MRRPAFILTLALAAAACTCQAPPAPVVTSVQPSGVPNDVNTLLTVRGANFLAAVKAEMDDPALSQVNATFALGLVRSDGTQVTLTGATLLSESEIQATVPAGASPGTYDLRLVDPEGRVAVLPSALLVYVPSCSNPLAPDGTPCNDGNLCTQVDTCQGGVCVGSNPVVCSVLDACHPGACDPGTGLCSNPPAPDGTPCRRACIAGETCQAGACVLRPATGCMNTAPLACLVVTPASGAAGVTPFTYDASCSTDIEDAAAIPPIPLSVAIDVGDAAPGYAWQALPLGQYVYGPHVYSPAGMRTASAQVTDSGGLTTYAQVGVVVYDPTTLVKVTTAVDENDAGATPTNSGGTGLSLREAISYVNANPPPAGPWTIGFMDGLGPISLKSPLPPLAAPGAALVGRSDASGLPAVGLDFGGANQPCITLGGPGQLLAWLRVTGCDATAIALATGSAGSQVTECRIEAPVGALTSSTGVSALDSVTVGPRNLVAGWATGVAIAGAGGLVDGNTIRANGTGIAAAGVPAGATLTVQRNRVHANAGAGMEVGNSGGSLLVRHNLFHGNGIDGFDAATAMLVMHDNLFTGNGHYGVNAPPGDFAAGAFDHNGFFGNLKGAAIPPLATGPSDVLADPRYIDAAAGDFRLAPDSPAVNAGVDTGLDVNGPAPGLYNGLAPDLGPEETPY